MQRLTDLESLTYHTTYYVHKHNEVVPHSALMGLTPLEMYPGNWTIESAPQAHGMEVQDELTNCA